jgi:hypothetical protein
MKNINILNLCTEFEITITMKLIFIILVLRLKRMF